MITSAVLGLIVGAICGFCIGVAFAVAQDCKIQAESAKPIIELLSADEAYKGLIPRASIIRKCLEVMQTTPNAYCHDTAKEILRYTLDVPSADKENNS